MRLPRFPPRQWLPAYDRGCFAGDLRTALTLGVVVVPQAMAYATLAGLPPITGLYAAVVALSVYSLLGTSSFAAPAPAAIDALLVAAAVGPLADGDPQRYVVLAGTLALLSGLLQVGAGLLRLGRGLVSYVSGPVVTGFTMAAALTIVVTQLPTLLGLPERGTPGSLGDGLRVVATDIEAAQVATTAVGLACVAALVLLRRRLPAWLPAPMVVLVAATVVAALVPVDRLRLVGDVPQGLPAPTLPSLAGSDLRALLPAAAALALISYLESMSATSTFAQRTRSRLDANQELLALGAANLACGLFRGLNVAAGFSRGAIMFGAGARTPLACLLTAAVVAVILLTLSPVLAVVPTVALAAIIVVAVAGLVDGRATLEVARVRRTDLLALLAAFTATAAFGPVTGLAVGVGVSLMLFLRQSARPPFPELGRVSGTSRYRNLARHDDIHTDPDVLLLRLDAPLYFANHQAVTDRILAVVTERPALRYVVFDASAMTWIDYSGTEMLNRLEQALGENGVQLHLAAMRGPPRDVLLRTRRGRWLAGHGRLHPDVQTAVAALDLAPDSPLTAAPDGSPAPPSELL